MQSSRPLRLRAAAKRIEALRAERPQIRALPDPSHDAPDKHRTQPTAAPTSGIDSPAPAVPADPTRPDRETARPRPGPKARPGVGPKPLSGPQERVLFSPKPRPPSLQAQPHEHEHEHGAEHTGPSRATRAGSEPERRLIGQVLVDGGALDPGDLTKALALQARQDVRLGNILLSRGLIQEEALQAALAKQYRMGRADLAAAPPDPALIDRVGADRCLALGILPWLDYGAVVAVATARPDQFAAQRQALERALGPVVPALATEDEIQATIARMRGPALAQRAERLVPDRLSCRGWATDRAGRIGLATLITLALAFALAPTATTACLAALGMVGLAASSALKAGALFHLWALHRPRRPKRRRRWVWRRHAAKPLARPAPQSLPAAGRPTLSLAPRQLSPTQPMRLPMVSMMVPLYQEEDIATRLLERLNRLIYPRELTEILLLTEAHDTTTAAALARCTLPGHIRVLTVPPGTVQTKPRALNYGLPFCRGQIVGIWDAEDAPAPDQLHCVVEGFAARGPEVACLQGALDFYNARANWIARCFTLEYAMWFRVLLPGLQAMGLPIPLGGTTLFFRRAALERLAGWDAHNVTEDADLGIRLARFRYRTEMVDTVTREEANCRPVPWIKQRSRWLKGYAMTWAVHMRHPGRLWRDLGPRGFLGFNALFLGALLQFLLAPVLLSFWLMALGLPHPLSGALGPGAATWGLAAFLTAEAIGLTLAITAASTADRRFLLPWIPTLHLYFPLAALAAYRAVWEMVRRPFYWDKTAHGLHDESPWDRARAKAAERLAAAALPSVPITRASLWQAGRANRRDAPKPN